MTITELTNKIGIEYNKSTTEMGEYAIPNGRIDRLFSHNDTYVIVETKNNINHALINDKPQLDKYCDYIIEHENVKHIISILCRLDTNEVITFIDGELRNDINSIKTMVQYEELFVNAIDKDAIWRITMDINENMNSNLGMSDLTDRMIFTACSLVARSRFNANLKNRKGEGYLAIKECVSRKLTEGLSQDIRMNVKLALLAEKFDAIETNNDNNITAANKFIDQIEELAGYINNKNWRGEDVMHIFFDEFNRYGGSSTLGQVFTPEHVVDLMCKLMHINENDHVLDACCGSGTFLTKAMSIMLNKVGDNEEKRLKIFKENLYGIELDKKVFCLAAANMLVHKDGKTNIIQDDALSEDSRKFMQRAGITKVLMNPPYEDCYNCIDIVLRVMESVPVGTPCAFILPNQKLTIRNNWKKFSNHTLTRIIKLPIETFDAGTDTSIFFFTARIPQGNTKVQAYRLDNDGLIRVKNRGRHDIMNRWKDICEVFIEGVESGELEHNTGKIQDVHSYISPTKEIELEDIDMNHILVDMFLFENGKEIIYNLR